MAKQTLLELVQNILSDINSDEVNSIGDTVESTQIAETIKSVYFDIIADTSIPEHFTLKQLTALGDITKPNFMQMPTGVSDIKWVKYDTQTATDISITYTKVEYIAPEDFLDKVLSLDSTLASVTTVTDDSGASLLIRNDKFPEFFTTFDDDYLVFDSYNAAEETTLTATRSLMFCSSEPIWAASDSFIPDLDSTLFPLLLAEAKSLVFINNTQSSNPKVEQIAKRHQARKQGRKHRISRANNNTLPNFGRKR